MTILYLREYSRMLRMKWSLNAKVKVQGQHKRQVQFLGHALNPENHAKTGGSFAVYRLLGRRRLVPSPGFSQGVI